MGIKSTKTLDVVGNNVHIRLWQRDDDIQQQLWLPYTEPFSDFWNLPRQKSWTATFLENFWDSVGGKSVWAVENNHQILVGRISLRDINHAEQQARLGVLFDAPYLGQGLGTEALRLFLDYFFGTYGFGTMLLDVAACNRRAVRCYQRLGFDHIGDDWRRADVHADVHLLEQPQYHNLRSYFRQESRIVWVQYLEMALHKHAWTSHVTMLSHNAQAI